MTADLAVTAALRALAEALDELGTPAMVIGGIAVIARGVPRTTLDIERLLVTHPDQVNVGRVRALVAEFAVALDAPERVAEFEALLARVSR
jgi:hypothetical protein